MISILLGDMLSAYKAEEHRQLTLTDNNVHIGIKAAPFPSYSDAELRAAIDHGHDGIGHMAEELKRRERVRAGDTSVMTQEERDRA